MFRPMLAAKLVGDDHIIPFGSLRYPLLASPKLDGIRAVVINGAVYSRSMKRIPNGYIQYVYGREEYNGLDGELILGEPTAKDCFRETTSAVMTQSGEPHVCFWVFDNYLVDAPFKTRMEYAAQVPAEPEVNIMMVPHIYVHREYDILRLEEEYLRVGYEGVMLRDPAGRYKQGRSTLSEGGLLKLKRFLDGEAEIIGVLEQMHNANEAKPDERGYMKRSSHQENKVPKGKLGALSVKDLKTGVEFEIGTGFSDADRVALWGIDLKGQVVRYRYFPTGSKDKPRFPVYDGFRHREDL